MSSPVDHLFTISRGFVNGLQCCVTPSVQWQSSWLVLHPSLPAASSPAVLCDVISVATEFMVSLGAELGNQRPSVLCDVISMATEFMAS
jgi:hypothetical protein